MWDTGNDGQDNKQEKEKKNKQEETSTPVVSGNWSGLTGKGAVIAESDNSGSPERATFVALVCADFGS